MSDLLHDADLQTQRAPKTKPPTRWRNKFYQARGPVTGIKWGQLAWPSRDVARTRAAEHMVQQAHIVKLYGVTYLGAFPVDENGEPLP